MAVIIGAILALVAAFEVWNRLLTPNQKKTAGVFLTNFYAGAVDIAQPLLTAVEGELRPIVLAFVSAFQTYGAPIAEDVRAPVAALAHAAYSTSAAGLEGKGESTPDNALDIAATAFADAFGFGISSAVVTAAFEAAFPEKLNTLNGVGPMLAKMAGFDEVAAEVLGPLYKSAFGRSLEYHFRSIFKPELPDEGDAVTWHSRRLLSDAQLRTVFKYSGLKSEYEEPYVASAYRAVQPRALATLFQDVEFPRAQMQSMLEFAGLRPQDVPVLLDAFEWASTKNVRQQYEGAVVAAWERGILTDTDALSHLDDLQFSDQAKHFVQLTVAVRKLEQLAELYRKSITAAYEYGQLSDAEYVPALEAIGIADADARAHYAVDSMRKHGKDAIAAARAAAATQRQIDRAAVAAAKAQYTGGLIDDVLLAAQLAAAEVPAAAIPFVVELESIRKASRKRFVFGAYVTPDQAIALREQVSALKEQRIKHLVDDAGALAQLATFNVPAKNAADLVAEWAAQADKELLPIR